jgi:hypothetical protein
MEHHLSLDAGVGRSQEVGVAVDGNSSCAECHGIRLDTRRIRALPGPDVPDVAGPNICIAQIQGWKFRVIDVRDGSFVDP